MLDYPELKPGQRWRCQVMPGSYGKTFDFTLVKPLASGYWKIKDATNYIYDTAITYWWTHSSKTYPDCTYTMILLCAQAH